MAFTQKALFHKITSHTITRRFLSNLASSERQKIDATFVSGFFRFRDDADNFVVHYQTPVTLLANVLNQKTKELTKEQEPNLNVESVNQPVVKVVDADGNAVPAETGTIPLTIGDIFAKNQRILLIGPVCDRELCVDLTGPCGQQLKQWEAAELARNESVAAATAAANQRDAILTLYQPMSDQFMRFLSQAEMEANKRFKWGGLFLLSAQLGFVSRLTWFEYSWDIMEPVTWVITYSLMISTFAYYVLTSQEFLLPLAEKRAVHERFWKILRKNNFDVNQFKQLRRQVIQLEQKNMPAGQTAFDRVLKAIQS